MLRSRPLCCALCPLIGLAILLLLLFLAPTPAAAQGQPGSVSFIRDVAPILKQNCFGCHDAKKKSGKFDMTTYEKFRTGGRSDDPVIPGNSKASNIMYVLTTRDAAMMPPKEAGGPLPQDKIDTIAAWIQQGARLDQEVDAKADLLKELRTRWQPPEAPLAYQYPANINALLFTPDSKKLVVGGYHELTVWDAASGKLERRVRTRAERAYDMEFLPDGNLAVAGGRPGQEGDVRVYNVNAQGTEKDGVRFLDGVGDKSVLVTELIQTDDSILTLDVSDDGKKLAAAGCDRLVRIWDIAGGVKSAKLIDTIENHADWVLAVNFSPNGEMLITAGRDKSSKVWDLKAKESLVTFQDHGDIVYGAVISPDNKVSISVGEDRNVRFWQSDSQSKQLGKQIRASGGHGKGIFGLTEYREGNNVTLATCSADGTVRLWNGSNGQNLKTLTGFDDWVYAVDISPDGKLVAAGGYGGSVRVWRVDNGELVKAFSASPGLEVAAQADKK